MARKKKTVTKRPASSTLYGIIEKLSPGLMDMARHLEEVSREDESDPKTTKLFALIDRLDPDLMNVAQALAGELLTFEEARRERQYAVADAVINKLPLTLSNALYTIVIENDELSPKECIAAAQKVIDASGVRFLEPIGDVKEQSAADNKYGVSPVGTLDL